MEQELFEGQCYTFSYELVRNSVNSEAGKKFIMASEKGVFEKTNALLIKNFSSIKTV